MQPAISATIARRQAPDRRSAVGAGSLATVLPVRPPVVTGIGAALAAGGGVGVGFLYPDTARSCAAVGYHLQHHADPAFVDRCLEPGMGLMACIVVLLGGAALLVYGTAVSIRSWRQRAHALPAGSEGPTVAVVGADQGLLTPTGAFFPPAGLPGANPPPGWYRVPPDYVPMWWDGTSWGVAPASHPPPGWYPVGNGQPRWWDGTAWTDPPVEAGRPPGA
jgi:hypothetical protein